jgi:ABC-type nitrate/sulfonate/bicarbonate transport system substrate-binding protein
MLIEAGIDPERNGVRIVGVPGTDAPGVSFGVAAAQALADGKLDGFWANAMGAENAVRHGVGKVILDVRRGLGPSFAFHYTLPVLVASDRAITRDPDLIAAGIRAVVDAQRALKSDVSLATKVGRALFPPAEAELIATTVSRDLPYYDPAIFEETVDGINRFAKAIGLLQKPAPFEQVVATQFRQLWTS